jgi:DNA-binding transcriptional LysR family regulator
MQKLDMSRLDLNLLVVFETMMEVRSVTAVSELLALSQPNVSYALKKLRTFFGDELFIRSGRGMQPTAKALELQEPIKRMMEILRNEVLNPVEFVPKNSQRTFFINMTELGELAFLPPLLKHFSTVAPHLTVEPVCLGAQELLDALRDGRVDLALGYFPELTVRTLYAQTLLRHPFACLAREGHPQTLSGFAAADYAAAEHVGIIGEGHAQRRFEEQINKAGIERRIRLRSRNFMSIPFIVRETDLIATVPKIMAVVCMGTPGLQVLKPPFEIDPIPITQYWSERQHNDPGQVWLRRTLAQLYLDNDPTANIKFW